MKPLRTYEAAKRRQIKGWIYIWQNGEPDRVKVGFATDLIRRKKQLETASSRNFTEYLPPIPAVYGEDKILHKLFPSRNWIKREWFFLDEKLLAIIKDYRDNKEKKNVLPLFNFDIYGGISIGQYPQEQASHLNVNPAPITHFVEYLNGITWDCYSLDSAQRLAYMVIQKKNACWIPDDLSAHVPKCEMRWPRKDTRFIEKLH
jgi:hypothetical protein